MLMRTFGQSATKLPVLGLGCSRIGSFSNAMTSAETLRLLEYALDLGVTLFDTADIYGQGDSERAIGRLLRRRDDKAFVITKVGKTFSAKMRLLRPIKPLVKPLLRRWASGGKGITARREGVMGADFSAAAIKRAVDASLRRLNVDAVDAVLLHSPNARELANAEVGDVLARIKRAGKIRHFGIACDDAEALAAALAFDGLDLVEIPVDILQGMDRSTQRAIRDRRIGVVVREVIRYRGESTPCAAVRAVTRHPLVTTAVVGTGSRRHLRQLAEAVEHEGTPSDAAAFLRAPADAPVLRV